MNYFYVLQSERDKNLYFGYSADLKRRLEEHQKGKVESTKDRRPLRLVYYEAYASNKDARERELQMKDYGRAWAQLKRRINRSIHEV